MSVVRVGSTKKFADNWDKIFSGKNKQASKPNAAKKKSPAGKKKAAKKKR